MTRPYQVAYLKQDLNYYIKPVSVKNTTFYFDTRIAERKLDGGVDARISYKYYTYRYPKVHKNKDKKMPLEYDQTNLHYKELHFYDDMINKINDEKEIWPGIKL